VEKPITMTVASARELLRLAERLGLIIQVGHVERFNPAILAVEKILMEPRFIECHRQACFQPRGTEVGVVLDLMIHDLDIILHLVASPVAELEAVGVPILTRHEDLANARLKFKSGCIANVTASRVSVDRMRKIRIFQDDAYISLDYIAQEAMVYRKEVHRITRERLPALKSEPLKLELGSFVECVRLGGKPQVPPEHALEALKVATDIIREVQKSERKLKKLQEKAQQEWGEEEYPEIV
jgi:predicted dehydrogenase